METQVRWPWLATDGAFLLSRRWRGFGWLDNIGRGRLGGSGRVFACSGQLRLQVSDGGLDLRHGRSERIDLRLQAFAVGTGSRGFSSHEVRFYDFQEQRLDSVNGYPIAS